MNRMKADCDVSSVGGGYPAEPHMESTARAVRRLRGALASRRAEARRDAAEIQRRIGTIRAGGWMRSRARVADAYWWQWRANFGDALMPEVLGLFEIAARWSPADKARVVGIGSILEHLPPQYRGIIWGSGLTEARERRFPHARVLAVRGRLTLGYLGLADNSDVALGDPGLLVADIYPSRPRTSDLAIVPHFIHQHDGLATRLARAGHYTVRVLDVGQHPASVIRSIAAAGAVATSSLHGLVVADAIGIPAVWFRESRDSPVTQFKFHDYESVVTPGRTREVAFESGDPTVPDLLQHASRADRQQVEEAKVSLRRSGTQMAGLLPAIGSLQYLLGLGH
jgi:hypothetical protein